MFGEKITRSPSAGMNSAGTEKEEGEEKQATPTVTIAAGVPYTDAEKALLQSQLKAQPKPPPPPKQELGDAWVSTTLPLLVSMVEKVLQLAAQHCEDGGDADISSTTSDNTNTSTKATTAGPVTSASKLDRFLEENTYIVEQLRLQQWPFFTLPRLWEVLADPFKYNTNARGRLRAEKLQAAVRRCVLVSSPLLTAPLPDAG
ncbi:hypothetical protein DQ04_15151010 [Trypanosoma grayi]|uniref:hypothetical protein n=1 Tax=Trypanosoma grayi TaxID=71804 RepID=UPI0004F47CC8|nr:hypothetical protein DQ04_15151010 [Trypanosoma grayi]KEG06224.1 hypothetical protein DQ04_15151010 [Trypanosoma grayi]